MMSRIWAGLWAILCTCCRGLWRGCQILGWQAAAPYLSESDWEAIQQARYDVGRCDPPDRNVSHYHHIRPDLSWDRPDDRPVIERVHNQIPPGELARIHRQERIERHET